LRLGVERIWLVLKRQAFICGTVRVSIAWQFRVREPTCRARDICDGTGDIGSDVLSIVEVKVSNRALEAVINHDT
jgi:hypothetical protein